MRLATRGSPLALWQARFVDDALGGGHELVLQDTTGDRRQDITIEAMGGQGVFVKEVQAAVLDGRADAAVHSAKDLPSQPTPGLALAAFPRRADPRDALVGSTLAGLPQGAQVATGSVRRGALLKHLRPDVEIHPLRGNIATRLAKAEGFDAIVMAVAALERLGLEDRITEALDPDVMVPQVGQGAIAVECRTGDEATLGALLAIDDGATRWAVTAERAFLARLGSGCTLPVAAHATGDSLAGVIAAHDGSLVLRHRASGSDAVELGTTVADYLLDAGGRELLR